VREKVVKEAVTEAAADPQSKELLKMSEQTQTAPEAVTFHPLSYDAAGRPVYKHGNQLRKIARVGDLNVGELRWSKSKSGIWSLKLHRSGKTQFEIVLGRKRDQRDPRMMAALRAQATELRAEALAAAAPAPAAEIVPEQPQLPAPDAEVAAA